MTCNNVSHAVRLFLQVSWRKIIIQYASVKIQLPEGNGFFCLAFEVLKEKGKMFSFVVWISDECCHREWCGETPGDGRMKFNGEAFPIYFMASSSHPFVFIWSWLTEQFRYSSSRINNMTLMKFENPDKDAMFCMYDCSASCMHVKTLKQCVLGSQDKIEKERFEVRWKWNGVSSFLRVQEVSRRDM